MKKNKEEEKSKSDKARDKRKETTSNEGKEVAYPLVPSKKDKECHLARFLDIFRKLEITMPFGEALQQMPLYSKFLKDMLTKKHKYIHQENIVVEGNCSAVIQKILPPKHKDPGSLTIPCSIGEVTVGKALIDLDEEDSEVEGEATASADPDADEVTLFLFPFLGFPFFPVIYHLIFV